MGSSCSLDSTCDPTILCTFRPTESNKVGVASKKVGAAGDTIETQKVKSPVQMVDETCKYDYDMVVIGGGSGGLACAKKAALFGKKVACLDYVTPSTQGTVWGLGGTCVNVGCIPKKLMHQAALLGEYVEDAKKFGWNFSGEGDGEGKVTVTHQWEVMKNNIQDHISSLNWGYRVQLREKRVKYLNCYGEFIDNHKITAMNHKGKKTEVTAETFVLATGGRPDIPSIPGAVEYGISSDDLFSRPFNPGKTLLVGASYVSLECAGFLAGIGLDVTVMVRSILLRGFDQQMAQKIGDHMESHGVKFLRSCVPTKVEKLEDGKPGRFKVTGKNLNTGEEVTHECNTVMFATGRKPCTGNMGLDKVGVKLNSRGFVITDETERTNIPNIYAIGDIAEGRPELTPVAVKAGMFLCRRLYGGCKVKTDYTNIPTTIFTPMEYGCVGLSEEDAIQKYGEDNVEVYHTNFWPLEHTVPKRPKNDCYLKIICHIPDDERLIGFHFLGPHAAEITQGFALGLRSGATKEDLDSLVGIHPSVAELFTTLRITKRSGESVLASGC